MYSKEMSGINIAILSFCFLNQFSFTYEVVVTEFLCQSELKS